MKDQIEKYMEIDHLKIVNNEQFHQWFNHIQVNKQKNTDNCKGESLLNMILLIMFQLRKAN